MPSLFTTLVYSYKKFIQPKRARIIHVLVRFAILFVIAVACEVFVFNFKSLTTAFNSPVDISQKMNLQQTADKRYVVSNAQNTIEITDINAPVDNIYLKTSQNQGSQVFKVKINFTDSGHSTYFNTTDYTVGVPEVEISTLSDRSQHFSIHATGQIKNLKLQFGGERISYPLYIDGLFINTQYPFNFNGLRMMAAFALLFLIYVFRPKSSIYKIKLVDRPLYSRTVIVFTIFIQSALLSAYLFMGSNLVGVATSNYNYGDWDGVSPVNTFEIGGDNAQQYAELAKSFTQGKLYLSEEPPDYLKNLDDPYDKGSRDEMEKQTGQKYLFDVAYYNGHYYVYFGVVPVLMFYLPFYLLTGANFPTAIGVLIMCILFVIGASVLLDRFARYHFERVSLGLYLLLQIPLVICCGMLYLCKFPTFYSLPISCALAFAVWALYFWMRGRASEKPYGWFLAGSFCMALIAGCRPQIMLIALVAIPLFWRRYITNSKLGGIKTKSGRKEILCLFMPFVFVAIGLMYYNYARFGSVTNFGANYNLTMNDMTQRGMQISRILPAIFAYFIQAPNVVGVFPFIKPVVFATTYLGQTIKEVTFGGVFACLPVLWILFFAIPLLKARNKVRKTNTVMGVIIVLLAVALIIAILDAQVAGILQRYYADFSFMLLISAILLAFIANESISLWAKKYKSIITGILIAVVSVSCIYSLLTCFVVENGWYGDVYNWAYVDFIKSFLFWT